MIFFHHFSYLIPQASTTQIPPTLYFLECSPNKSWKHSSINGSENRHHQTHLTFRYPYTNRDSTFKWNEEELRPWPDHCYNWQMFDCLISSQAVTQFVITLCWSAGYTSRSHLTTHHLRGKNNNCYLNVTLYANKTCNIVMFMEVLNVLKVLPISWLMSFDFFTSYKKAFDRDLNWC